LHRHYDFYVGVEPLLHGVIYKYHLFKFCNAIIGSAPHHPLLQTLITNMKANYLAYGKAGVIERTGPSYLTRIICEYELRGAHAQRNMYLPCTFFYPFTICESPDYVYFPEKIIEAFPETAAIHYWGQSWQAAGCTYVKYELIGNL
jgi:mannosyltransferase OCH1-like enzyme